MLRFVPFVGVAIATIATAVLSVAVSWWWLIAAAPLVTLTGVGIWDFFQTEHSILRNFPIIAHFRYMLESVRPEIQQYFVESDTNGAPFPRNLRSLIYRQAKVKPTLSRSAPSVTCMRRGRSGSSTRSRRSSDPSSHRG